jgi:hypothetical protein
MFRMFHHDTPRCVLSLCPCVSESHPPYKMMGYSRRDWRTGLFAQSRCCAIYDSTGQSTPKLLIPPNFQVRLAKEISRSSHDLIYGRTRCVSSGMPPLFRSAMPFRLRTPGGTEKMVGETRPAPPLAPPHNDCAPRLKRREDVPRDMLQLHAVLRQPIIRNSLVPHADSAPV